MTLSTRRIGISTDRPIGIQELGSQFECSFAFLRRSNNGSSLMEMRSVAHFLTLLLLLPPMFWQFAAFDRLVRIEYVRYRTEWNKDGSPYGFFWRPPEAKFFSSMIHHFARAECSVRWLFHTPGWTEGDNLAHSLLTKFRRRFVAFTILWLPAFFLSNIALMYLASGQ
jgi:hypothetical protein